MSDKTSRKKQTVLGENLGEGEFVLDPNDVEEVPELNPQAIRNTNALPSCRSREMPLDNPHGLKISYGPKPRKRMKKKTNEN